MDELQLSETEQRYFSDLFVCCDNENTGKVPVNKAIELFRSGNVPNDVLNQITDLCCHKQNQQGNYFSRKQFFSMLKLISAHQANIPLRGDLLSSSVELPLPRFTWPSSENRNSSNLIELSEQNHRPHGGLSYKPHMDSVSTDSEVEVADVNGTSTLRNGSPEASSTASDSPTPTNSVQERSWAVSGNWQGLVCEEQRQLLGTEEESSDRHSSEEDTEISNEVWTITPEQREYYATQFRSLQPDPNCLLAGPIARLFFEKSRLPVGELRKIWQLADVTKDGALSLQEFNTAMHLVVLRRNHITLPSVLPPQLVPDRGETTTSVSPPTEPVSPPPTKDTAKEWTKFVDSPTSSISSPGPKPVNFDFQKASVEKDPKILHPVPLRLTPDIAGVTQTEEGPVTEQLDVSSPKKPLENTLAVNQNDIRPIQRPQPKKIGLPGRGAIPPPPQATAAPAEEGGPVSLPAPKKEPPPPPPPRPFRSHGRSSSLDLNRLGRGGLLGAPPTVPPRVSPNIPSPGKKLINQRSEGDVITLSGEEGGAFANFDQFQHGLEPAERYENVSEGIFPGDVYEADRSKLFAQFTQAETAGASVDTADNGGQAPRKHGAFEVYRKPTTAARSKESPIPSEDTAKWELFKKLKEQNTVLLRLCQELSQELADVREERTTLRLRLEQQQQQSAG